MIQEQLELMAEKLLEDFVENLRLLGYKAVVRTPITMDSVHEKWNVVTDKDFRLELLDY